MRHEFRHLHKSYSYQNTAEIEPKKLRRQIKSKTVVPYQVEFQPPPASLRRICWLECEYCYGASADDEGSPRMSRDLALKVLNDLATGGVKKIIFAGYATDPLNSPIIGDLLEKTVERNLTFGFNTKALKVPDKIIEIIKTQKVSRKSYMSLSIDAGSNETYNKMHSVKTNAKLYDRVLNNAEKIRTANSQLTLSAAYLINKTNCNSDGIQRFIKDFKDVGCNYIRFSFLQEPKDINLDSEILPNKGDLEKIKREIENVISAEDSEECPVKFIDIDHKENIFGKAQTIPCFARFIFPTVGYDGWLYNCSQSSSPNFHSTALGDLSKDNFWDLFYNYSFNNEQLYFCETSKKLKDSGCRCDRKMHLANKNLIRSNVFDFGET